MSLLRKVTAVIFRSIKQRREPNCWVPALLGPSFYQQSFLGVLKNQFNGPNAQALTNSNRNQAERIGPATVRIGCPHRDRDYPHLATTVNHVEKQPPQDIVDCVAMDPGSHLAPDWHGHLFKGSGLPVRVHSSEPLTPLSLNLLVCLASLVRGECRPLGHTISIYAPVRLDGRLLLANFSLSEHWRELYLPI
jgi:hypothetical protein